MSAYTKTRRELVRLRIEWKKAAQSCSIEGDKMWINGVATGIKIAIDTVEKFYRVKSKFDRR